MSDAGLNSERCGTTNNPCKTLRYGVRKVKASGNLYLRGNQTVDRTIVLKRNITIIGVGALINSSKDLYVFQTKLNINTTFVSLRLHGVGLIDMSSITPAKA